MMDILVCDFETYYDKDYSLSKLTTEEYIRDTRFEVIGVSVKVNAKKTVWFSGTKKATKKFLDMFDWGNSVAIAHNAMFDMAILNWHFDIRPKRIADTLSMARALHTIEVGGSLKALAEYYGLQEKGTYVQDAIGKCRLDFDGDALAEYGEYCITDTEITGRLFKKLAEDFPIGELRLIDLTIRMFTEPKIVLDQGILESSLEGIKCKKEELLARTPFDKKYLMSNNKFAEILGLLGVQIPMKISPTTGKETYAFAKTDEGLKKLAEHPNYKVQTLVAVRLGTKSTIAETRTQRFLDISKRGTLPVPLRYYAAHTGRWGGADKINLQNLPKGSEIKFAMRAPEGFTFTDSDSSQIECRVLAWLSGQLDLVEAFEKGEDVYKIMASKIYGKPVDEVSKADRHVGKTTILGCGYGMGAAKFKDMLGAVDVAIPLEESQGIIETYRQSYPAIPALWKDAGRILEVIMRNEYTEFGVGGLLKVEGKRGIKLPNGMYLRYPNLRKEQLSDDTRPQYYYDTKKGRSTIPNRIYGGKCVENITQGLARIIIGNQLLLVAKKFKVVTTVHDAIGSLVPTEDLKSGIEYIELCMRTRPGWAMDLPLNCETVYGNSYGEC